MSETSFRILALGHARSSWMNQLTQWSTAGVLPADITKCVSSHEVVARFSVTTQWSALFIDATINGLDRDLIGTANDYHIPVIVIDGVPERYQRWMDLGAQMCLDPLTKLASFIETLRLHAQPTYSDIAEIPNLSTPAEPNELGALFAVCGAGGTGASSTAVALAQGIATTDRSVVLVDLARNAQQGMLHDANDVIPSIDELVETCRVRSVEPDELRNATYRVAERGYDLLLGMHRATSWTALTPRACTGALAGLQNAYDYVVADITADFQGEQDTGSRDIEDRNLLNRTAASRAHLVFVVATPCMKGLHSFLAVTDALLELGVAPGKIVPVITRAPKRGKGRAEIAKAVRVLTRDRRLSPMLFLPDKPVDRAFQDGVALPHALVAPITQAAGDLLAISTSDCSNNVPMMPEPITPGTLGIAKSA